MFSQRPNLETAFLKGVVQQNDNALETQFINTQLSPTTFQTYFSIGLSQLSWFGDQIGIMISGICPSSNRSPSDVDYILKQKEQELFSENARQEGMSSSKQQIDNNSMSYYSDLQPGFKEKEKLKNYKVRIEIRSSSQELIQIVRSDIESLIIQDLSEGHIIISC